MSIAEAVASGCIAGSSTPSLSISLPAPPYLQGGARPCRSTNPELFFPFDYTLTHHEQIEEAKAVCRSCPVRDLCAAWAIPQANLDGIWGALTPPERQRLRIKGRAR